MIRDVFVLCRVRDARNSTPALPTSTAAARTTPAPRAAQGRERSRSPDPLQETAADRARREGSVVPGGKAADAGRSPSAAYRATSPGLYYEKKYTDEGLSSFIQSNFPKYTGYETAIEKVAECLYRNAYKTEEGRYDMHQFNNGFDSLDRTLFLIRQYVEKLQKQDHFLDTTPARAIFVVCEMENSWDGNKEGEWIEYLTFFENGAFADAQKRFEREKSPSYPPLSPNSVDKDMADPKDVLFQFNAGKDVPESPTSSKQKSVITKSIIGGKEGDKSRDVKKAIVGGTESPQGAARRQAENLNRTKTRRATVLQRIRLQQENTKKDPPNTEPATAATVLTIDDQRELLYDEDQIIRGRWKQHSGQITTLAGHLEVLLEDDNQFFPLIGQGSAEAIVNENTLTGKLYRYVEDYRKQYADDYKLLLDRFKFKILADEYVILHAMDADVQEIEENGNDVGICVDLERWVYFLSKMEKNVTDKAALARMTLGSELHTFPADASLDFKQNLTRRLEALQDW